MFPPWVKLEQGSIALLSATCNRLESIFFAVTNDRKNGISLIPVAELSVEEA